MGGEGDGRQAVGGRGIGIGVGGDPELGRQPVPHPVIGIGQRAIRAGGRGQILARGVGEGFRIGGRDRIRHRRQVVAPLEPIGQIAQLGRPQRILHARKLLTDQILFGLTCIY
jgi:hypothetical protein